MAIISRWSGSKGAGHVVKWGKAFQAERISRTKAVRQEHSRLVWDSQEVNVAV